MNSILTVPNRDLEIIGGNKARWSHADDRRHGWHNADAAGLEGALHITTDREGVPTLEGGACLTARDLARYMAIFVRQGRGVDGKKPGSAAFIQQTLSGGLAMPFAVVPRRPCHWRLRHLLRKSGYSSILRARSMILCASEWEGA